MISLLMLLVCFNCQENPFGPDIPEEPAKQYDLEVTYIRINISRPDLLRIRNIDFSIYLISSAGEQCIASPDFSQIIDDYTFKGEISQLKNNIKQELYAIYVADPARYDGLNKGSIAVGDQIILRVKQTNFEKELKDIRTSSIYPMAGAKMACFILTVDGKIISDAQN
jgi:hypothetical protein